MHNCANLPERGMLQFAMVLYKAASIEVKFRTILKRLALGQQQTEFH
jgi:hypothetical protein